ncbi:hypothetical protein OROGR_001175 [Orobanche gracilis]
MTEFYHFHFPRRGGVSVDLDATLGLDSAVRLGSPAAEDLLAAAMDRVLTTELELVPMVAFKSVVADRVLTAELELVPMEPYKRRRNG